MPFRMILLLLSLALLVGVYLLRTNQEAFSPYWPAEFTDFRMLNEAPRDASLFLLIEGQTHAEQLRNEADAHLAQGHYDAAIDALHQALQSFSYLAGLYERLDAAYMASGRWALAREALDASLMRDTIVSFNPVQGAGVQSLPEVVEVTRARGLESCRHETANANDLVSPGVAVYDLDGDGDADVICLGGSRHATRVYRGGPDGFHELTDTGLEQTYLSQGVYVVDVNHDGLADVVITSIGWVHLYLNQGAFRFKYTNLPLPRIWASAVAAGDFTGNGHVDLVVGGWLGREVLKSVDEGVLNLEVYEDEAAAQRNARGLPNPDAPLHLLNLSIRYGETLRLLEGDGTGGFVDITERSGVNVKATTLNLELMDVNDDGHLDLIIINDTMPSRLFLGDGQGRFRDVTFAARFADIRSGMGLAIADFFANGHWDFIKTHFQGEMNGIFMHDGVQDGTPRYRDVGLESGLGAASLPYVGWAAFAWDFDADGQEDLLILNGHVRQSPQPVQLFQNQGGQFSAPLPLAFGESFRARGGALFDLNGNGHDDLLLVQNNGPARLFELQPRHTNQWIRVRVRVPDVDALGGVVELVDVHGRRQRRPVRTGSAYFSTQPRDFFFGLGKSSPKEVIWRGRASSFSCGGLQANSILTITKAGCEQSMPATLEPFRSPSRD